MNILTLQRLKDMESDTIFDSGISTTLNLINSNESLRWVAVRGGYHDWSIFAHKEKMSKENIADQGDKISSLDIVRRLVPCDNEALEMYRKD